MGWCLLAGLAENGANVRRSSCPSDASTLTRARVLIAEHDALVALHLMTALQAASYVVVGPVSSLAEALAIIDGEPPDAALLDLHITVC